MSSSTGEQFKQSNNQAMPKLPITVVILTINDEQHLPELLDSVLPYVEDVFIVDSRSVDHTVDIALSRGVKIIQRPFTTPPEQYGWAFKNLPIKTEWLFSMDQDERFSESLVNELRNLFAGGIPDDIDGFMVKWRLWFMGEPLHAISNNFRLMRTKKCWVTNVACNEHFCVPGRIVPLKGILEHKDTLNLHQWYEKQNLWTTLEAIQRVHPPSDDEKPRFIGGTRVQRKAFFKVMLGKFPGGEVLRFFYYYLKFGAWRDGWAGWHWARLRVWVEHVIQIKAAEMRRHGIPTLLPSGRHGDFDSRIMQTELQRQLLPDTVEEWNNRHPVG